VRTTGLNDGIWVNVRDVPVCFGTRTYATDDRFVVEVGGTRWAIGSGGVSRVRSRPDLVAEPSAMGALLLGGVSPTQLARGRRLTARTEDVLRRAELFFTTPIAPLSQTAY